MKNVRCLFGIIRYIRKEDSVTVKIFGINVYKKYLKSGWPIVSYFGIKFKLSLEYRISQLLNNCYKVYQKGSFSKIVVIFNNSGETSLFLSQLYSRQNEFKDAIFVYTQAYHGELLRLYCKNIRNLYYPGGFTLHLIPGIDKSMVRDNITISLVGTFDYFKAYEDHIVNSDINKIEYFQSRYFRYWLPFEVEKKLSLPEISNAAAENVRSIFRMQNITRPFVLVSNETKTNENLPDCFYYELVKQLHNNGYDVIFNSKHVTLPNNYAHTCFLPYQESMLIASQADAVIGIRSGFLDVVAPYAKHVIAIYTDFKERGNLPRIPAEKIMKAFSLSNLIGLPTNKIDEILVSKDDLTDIGKVLSKIINEIRENVNSA